MTLTGEQLGRIHEVLLAAYSRDELLRLVRVRMDVDFPRHVTPEKTYAEQVFEFIEWADRQERALELLCYAAEGNPGNTKVQTLWAEAQGWGTPAALVGQTGPSILSDQPHHIFLAYSRKDEAIMRRLRADLLAAGIVTWVDQDDLEPGTPVWQRAIETAIRTAKCVVVILTPDAKKSRWVTIEISLAHRLGLEIFPVLARGDEDSAVLFALETTNRIDLRVDYTDGLTRRLVPAILRHLEKLHANPAILLAAGPRSILHKPPIDIAWITIPKGKFLMGSDKKTDKLAYDEEIPQHSLYLDEFRIAKYPVTNSQYQMFVDEMGHHPPTHWRDGRIPKTQEYHPVTNVSWFDAIAFCGWLSEAIGHTIRLPTEAEWEKAARGTDGRIWPWGNVPPTNNHCNYGSFIGSTTPVERYSKIDGPYGAISMAGNIWEWTMSLLMAYPYQFDDGREDVGGNGQRALRGGSWISNDALIRCACRDGGDPQIGDITTGFRIMSPCH